MSEMENPSILVQLPTSCADYPLMNIEKPNFHKNKKNNKKIYPKRGSEGDFLAFLEIDYLYRPSKLTPAMIVKRPTPFNQQHSCWNLKTAT